MYYFLEPCENSTSLPAQAAVFSAASFSDIPASVLSRLMTTAEKSCSNGNAMESCRDSRYGTTCEPSTANRGADSSMLCAEDSHARTSVVPVQEQEFQANEAGYGENSPESLARYDPVTRSLKTRQTLLFEDSTESFLILPEWGWMRDGDCFQLAWLVPHIHDYECGAWPTPRASSGGGNAGGSHARRKALRRGTYVAQKQNPQLTEWLMGWPIGWTDLKPLETDKFRQWLNSHGKR